MLLNMIAEITGESLSGVNDRLRLSEDLHLDSLGRVQLQSALEQRLGLELEDDAIVGVETLGELRALLDWKEGTASQAAGTAAEAGPAPVSPGFEVPAAVSALQMAPAKERDALEHWFPTVAHELADPRDPPCFYRACDASLDLAARCATGGARDSGATAWTCVGDCESC